jgi:hypothetical protein
VYRSAAVTARSSSTSTPAIGRDSEPASRRITRPAKSAAASAPVADEPAVTIRQAAFQHTASVSGSPTSIAARASASRVRGSNEISA